MSDESIFREVDDEVRAEQAKKVWEKYGAYIMGLCIGVVVAVAGIKGYQAWTKSQNEAAGEQYIEAVELARAGKIDEAEKAFAYISENGRGGYVALARFQQAAALAERNQAAEAIKVYDEIAASSDVDQAMRDLARVRAGLLLVDTASYADLEKRMADLNKPDGAWRHSAREILALVAYRAGDLGTARQLFQEILADPATPGSIRQHAQIVLGLISPQGSASKDSGN
ncbi:MAG: tetratricopeptide repeat protein [Hyphomicrobiales bacterium]